MQDDEIEPLKREIMELTGRRASIFLECVPYFGVRQFIIDIKGFGRFHAGHPHIAIQQIKEQLAANEKKNKGHV